jgi:hypothetical protein
MTDKPMKIHYCKYARSDETDSQKPRFIDLDELGTDYKNDTRNPFLIRNLQLYNPIYSQFFEMTEKNAEVMSLNNVYHMRNMNLIYDIRNDLVMEKPVFIKFSPLLDPIRYMIGKYDVTDPRIRTMPSINSTEESINSKILSHQNSSYIDCFFSYLTSGLLHNHGFLNGVDFYGSYLGVQDSFRACVTDDLDYLRESEFFNKNVGVLFSVEDDCLKQDRELYGIAGSRGNKCKLNFGETRHNNSEMSITVLDNDLTVSESNAPLEDEINADKLVYEKPCSNSSKSSSASSDDSKMNYSSESESEDDDDGSEEGGDSDEESWETEPEREDDSNDSQEEDEEEVYGYIKDFPIQLICLEKCTGTLDELFVKEKIDEQSGAAALFQVVMSLLMLQKTFKFTHNDLHTNNIMYVDTTLEHLTYKFDEKVYKVPTYGKIFKLIDFGRAIYRFQDKIFCSDSFAPGGDASTQYNCEPFLNKSKPRLEPNMSFDLCRLGSSIFDFLMDECLPVSKMDELQKTIHRWCSDDNGKNVLYKKNGEERYPNFKLYKMIARTVHRHTPEAQLEFPFFSQFLVESTEKSINIDIDAVPCYASK